MIDLCDVHKVYPGGHVALRGLSLHIPAARTVALLGPSGCGKTTTLKLINRLLLPTAGRVCIDGRDVALADPVRLRRGIGYVVQEAGLFPHLTAAENVEVVPRLLGWPAARRRARTAELFALVGLEVAQCAGRYPAELSGGQRQRVGLARALYTRPSVLVLDEATSNLDRATERHIVETLEAIRTSLTMIVVTHRIASVRNCDRLVYLEGGAARAVGTFNEVRTAVPGFDDPIRAPEELAEVG
jgi:osmoprotectant transport system ATP-binding protein